MDTITDFISKKNHSINIQKYVVAGASKVHYILNLQDLQTAQSTNVGQCSNAYQQQIHELLFICDLQEFFSL